MSSDTTHKPKDLHEEERREWTTHTAANGLTYYFNTKTKKSTWTKPDCLKSIEEKYNLTDWQEYTTSEGKTFYHNAKLKKSIWKMPPELKALKDKQAEERKNIANKSDINSIGNQLMGKIQFTITSSIQEEPEDLNHKNQQNIQKELTKEEAVRLFMDILREKNVAPPMKWEQCQNLLSNDDRYNVIKGIGEKKRIFNEFIQMAKKAERNEVRNKIEQAKENFITMLETSPHLTSESKFHKVAYLFVHDPRWKVVEERDREILFQDYLDELYNKEKEDNRIKRKENIEKFKNNLLERSDISSHIKWEEVCQLYKDDLIFSSLTNYDQLVAFSEVIMQLEQKEYEEKRRVKRYNERKKREAFRSLLINYENYNTLIYKTKWKKFVQVIKDDPRFLEMLGQPGSTPRELFEDHMEVMIDNHKKIKEELKKYLKSIHLKVTFETTKEEFDEKMKDDELFSSLSDNKKIFYYHYCVNKAKSKEKEMLKKHKKSIKKFKKLLKSLKELNSDSKYEEYHEIFEENISHYVILTPEERLSIFNEYKINLGKIVPPETNMEEEKDKIKTHKKNKKKDKEKENEKMEFNSQESLSSKERQKFVDKYKRDYEKPDSQRKPKKDPHKKSEKRKSSSNSPDDSSKKNTKKENGPDSSSKMLEEFKKEILKIESSPPPTKEEPPKEEAKEEPPKDDLKEEKKEEGELDIKKTSMEEEKKEDEGKKKTSVSESPSKKKKDKKNKKKAKKTAKKKERKRSRSRSKSKKKKKGYSSSDSDSD